MRAVTSAMTEDQADAKVDPDRFTLREAIAHLNDWEPVFRERLRRIVEEDVPVLPNLDEGQLAIDHNYAETDWREQIEAWQSRRTELTQWLETLPIDAWQRQGNRPEIGLVTLQDLVLLIPLHDLYHLKQAREYLAG